MLERDFYLRDANIVAPELLGKILVHKNSEGITSGIIVEVEAYKGSCDKACHSYKNKRTSRTEIMFGLGGFTYIYIIYGMYYCFNVVANIENEPDAILIRALEPLEGIEIMKTRRKTNNILNLCSGPGKLCSAMGISRNNYGCDLCGNKLYITDYLNLPKEKICVSKRINIDYAEECKDFLWRYFINDNKFVSKVSKR